MCKITGLKAKILANQFKRSLESKTLETKINREIDKTTPTPAR